MNLSEPRKTRTFIPAVVAWLMGLFNARQGTVSYLALINSHSESRALPTLQSLDFAMVLRSHARLLVRYDRQLYHIRHGLFMKIVSVNVNGIRAAHRKGFFQWLKREDPDIVCIQETKAQEHQLHPEDFYPENYHCYYYDAEKKGYSGVAIYSKEKPKKVTCGLGEGWEDMDAEGRFIQADFDKFSVISLYLPSGSSSEERQQIKFHFLDRFVPLLKSLRRKRREFVICGDWNIAHKNIDIKNWRGNQKNSGFLPEERAWMDQLFGPLGYVDGFRVVNQDEDQYTWWSNRGQAWAKNVGWRIDYQVITPGLRDKVNNTSIYKDERFSDHAPLVMEYDL